MMYLLCVLNFDHVNIMMVCEYYDGINDMDNAVKSQIALFIYIYIYWKKKKKTDNHRAVVYAYYSYKPTIYEPLFYANYTSGLAIVHFCTCTTAKWPTFHEIDYNFFKMVVPMTRPSLFLINDGLGPSLYSLLTLC